MLLAEMKQGNKKELPAAVKEYLSMNGSKGGSVKSEKKTLAVRKNGCAPCRPGKFRGRPREPKIVPSQVKE